MICQQYMWVTAFLPTENNGKQHISTLPCLPRATSISITSLWDYETGRNTTLESLETASRRIIPCFLCIPNPSSYPEQFHGTSWRIGCVTTHQHPSALKLPHQQRFTHLGMSSRQYRCHILQISRMVSKLHPSRRIEHDQDFSKLGLDHSTKNHDQKALRAFDTNRPDLQLRTCIIAGRRFGCCWLTCMKKTLFFFVGF